MINVNEDLRCVVPEFDSWLGENLIRETTNEHPVGDTP